MSLPHHNTDLSAMTSSSQIATPKRKRVEVPAISSRFSFAFDLSQPDPLEDGDCSPRSQVVHRFCGLALGSGGGVLMGEGDDDDGTVETATRKRQKLDKETMDAGKILNQNQEEQTSRFPDPRAPVEFETHGAAADSPSETPPLSPDGAEASDIKALRCKRAGTPPLKLKYAVAASDQTANKRQVDTHAMEEDDDVVDPVRAALTWHEDEITVYDPEDADDDGFGVNGLGFKPTPALAHARAMRRRQQMADYRKREEGEARTQRTQRRRAHEPLSAWPKKKSTARRVHFCDPKRQHTVVFTQ